MLKYQTGFIAHSTVTTITDSGRLHIAVIGGGMSAEREVSLVSSNAVVASLVDSGYRVTFIDMGADIAIILAQVKPDIVYNCLHGTYGEDGCLQGLLNIMRIPYTHSGVLASSIAFNKEKSQGFFAKCGINIAKYVIVDQSDKLTDDPLPRPYVIKPLAQGSSIGVEIISLERDFNFADYRFPYGTKILVEQYFQGKDLQVAVLDGKAFGVLEIKLLQRSFYDYDSKYTTGFTEHLLPANIPNHIHESLLSTAEKAYNILGCKSLVRAEFIYNEITEEYIFLELNTHPGMTPLSICPEILAFYNISFNELVRKIIETASFE